MTMSKKKVALLLALASVAAAAVATDPHTQAANGTPLLLGKSIEPGGGIDVAGDLIMLREPKFNGCRYIGELRAAQTPSDLLNKALDIATHDNHVWSIEISRKLCGSKEESVALKVDLGRSSRYEAGTAVLAKAVR